MRPSPQQAQASRGISTVTLRFRASDGSSVDMKSGLRELTKALADPARADRLGMATPWWAWTDPPSYF
jgi:hypothetical protein